MAQNEATEEKEQSEFRTLRDAVWACEEICADATLVALRLVEHWPHIWPSLGFLSTKCKMSERQVRYCLRELESVGLIESVGRGRRSNRYYFLSEKGERVIIPRLGRRRAPPDGGGNPPPTEDPADFSEETRPSNVSPIRPGPLSTRQAVPPSTRQAVPPTRQAVPPSTRQAMPPKQITSLKQTKKRGGSRATRAPGRKRPTLPPLFTSFDGWTLSPELRDELIAMGVNGARIAGRVRALRNRPQLLGDGVRSLDDYIREQAEARWVVWDAQDAVSSGGNRPSSSVPGGGGTSGGVGGAGSPTRVAGFPPWVHSEHEALAKKHGLPLRQMAGAFAKESYHKPHLLDPVHVRVPFRKFIEAQAAKKAKAA